MESYIISLRRKLGSELLLCPSVAAVIRDDTGRILLQEKATGEGWSLPAGTIEVGETPQQAVIREVEEETGLIVVVKRIIEVFGGKEFRYTYPNGDEVEYVVTLFLCEPTGKSTRSLDAETKSTRYFAKEDMPSLALPYPLALLFGQDR